jgi:uncharacterized protein (DUF488 family)
MNEADTSTVTVWSIGHSTHSLERLVELLHTHGIAQLADIRTVPKSRRHPQFHTEALAETLPGHGIAYRHLPRLGGWRKALEDSPNDAWRNASFRGYADYAMSDEFAAGLAELRELASSERTAMMCSEALWWRCHRRIVADRLVAGGDTVCHIGSDGRVAAHELTGFAEIDASGQITYPAGRA